MTDRLYYADAYCRDFSAAITRVDRRDGRTVVVLDRTAFYPTSGGQPFDTGTLVAQPVQGNGEQAIDGGPERPALRVVDVIDDDDGGVAHVLDEHAVGALATGQTVHGSIDWTRRFDHMQQHTGQHVLSAAIDRLFDVRTVSFHLGREASTIDLARELSRDDLASAEAESNRVVWGNRSVSIRFVSAEDAAKMPLRKESLREGTLRLVDIDGFDLSACGGTHVERTGSIGVIAIGTVERFKGGHRVEFFCGGRALKEFRSMRDTLAGAVRLLSVLPYELPAAIDRLQVEAREQQRTVSALRQELASYRAEEIAASGEPTSVGQLVLRVVDADANGLRSLASAIVSKPGFVVALVSASRPALVVVARSQAGTVPAHDVVKGLTGSFGGRGGGKPELAQAGGLDGSPEDVLAAARRYIVGKML
jgi:alanyl-tRNA synthetase